MKKNFKYGIILPLKEVFLKKNSGAVSIFVNEYLKKSKLKNETIIFTLKHSGSYLEKNTYDIKLSSKIFTNYNYIKSITRTKYFSNLQHIEIHNRPNYAEYVIKNFPQKKVSLVLHNNFYLNDTDENNNRKLFLLQNCSSLIFVSYYLKKEFFKNLKINDSNNSYVIYNTISKQKKFNNTKEKLIVFAGKLNKSKGYDIFGKVILKILNKHKDWKALVIGNEKRESYSFKHKNLLIKDWLPHEKLIKIYNKTAITVVNPTWSEPFGRTALESSSRGCAVITSKSGGINETFNNNLILKKNDSRHLFDLLDSLILQPKLLKKTQKINFKNQIIESIVETRKMDKIKNLSNIKNIISEKHYNILHIGVFGAKQSYRTYGLSLASKISNGFIKNGHHVINFDYRSRIDYGQKFKLKTLMNKQPMDQDVLAISSNYKPHLVLLGHNNNLKRKTIIELKKKFNSKIAIWYEDHITKGDPNSISNLNLIEKNHDLIDNYFITTYPTYIKSKINKKKISFLPMPVDDSIEKFNLYNERNKTKDLFFGISHGVNRGILKKNHYDARIIFVNNLIKCGDGIRFNLLGFNNEQPKWNLDLYEEMKKCYFALNLSRGGPYKYTSSNRIATYVGNGMPICVDEKLQFSNFFNKKEMIFYKDEKDLIKKLKVLLNTPNKISAIGRRGKQKYFKLFNNLIIGDYILSKSLMFKSKYKFIWEK